MTGKKIKDQPGDTDRKHVEETQETNNGYLGHAKHANSRFQEVLQ